LSFYLQVLDGGASVDKIPESNVGSLLLKKMGWSGGGIGKNGNQGIEEPVSVAAVINRAGLGSGVSGDFAKAVSRVVVDYLHSDREDDLVFSSDFSNPERAAIHAEARKHAQQLKTRSYGSKESRYLVLSRRRTPLELVEHIRNNGGETLKYTLRAPIR
jgi:G-patch domain/R3H domain